MPAAKIRPCLWFDGDAEAAVDFYVSVFRNSKRLDTSRTGDGKVLTIAFEVEGLPLLALNGGPEFHFTEAVSLMVDCKSQGEVDELWEQLTADGGEESQCGWLKDKFGLSWQIVPTELPSLIGGPDRAGAARAMQAMFGMRKLDVQALRDAYEGRS
jgi:predicted 3-demethylubiquinone-9 3-methyltransferase (glyoxalase superfamily)